MELELKDQDIKDISEYLDHTLRDIYNRILHELKERGTLPIEFTEALETIGYYTREAISAVVNEPFDRASYKKAERHYEDATTLLVQLMINSRLLMNALDNEKGDSDDTEQGSKGTDAKADGSGQVRGDTPGEQSRSQPTEDKMDVGRGEVSQENSREAGLPNIPDS